jgi:hypothetical protein
VAAPAPAAAAAKSRPLKRPFADVDDDPPAEDEDIDEDDDVAVEKMMNSVTEACGVGIGGVEQLVATFQREVDAAAAKALGSAVGIQDYVHEYTTYLFPKSMTEDEWPDFEDESLWETMDEAGRAYTYFNVEFARRREAFYHG